MRNKNNFFNLIVLQNALLFVYLIAHSVSVAFSQTPCINEQAYNKPGVWKRQGVDDLAAPDLTFPRAEFAAVLAKAQKVVELFKKANPKLTGVEAKAQRSIRGKSYVPRGAVPFSVGVAYFDYYCVPDDPSYPEIRGTILANGESSMGVRIFFNSLGWIANEPIALRTESGDAIFVFPKESGTFKKFRTFRPGLRAGKDEAFIITPPGAPEIYRLLTRQEFILARKHQNRLAIDKVDPEIAKKAKEIKEALAKIDAGTIYTPEQKKQFRAIYEKSFSQQASAGGAQMIKYFEAQNQKLDELLASLSPAERTAPAIVKSWSADPVKDALFITESEGGVKLFTINRDYFNLNLSRQTVQLIAVYFFWDDKHPAKAKTMTEFKENFDFAALEQLLGK